MPKEQKKELLRLITATAIFAAIFCLDKTAVIKADMFAAGRYMLIPYMVPYLIAGWPVLRGCIGGIRRLELLDEEFLMTIATVGAIVIGEYSEAVAVMIFYGLGEFFQDYAVDRSRDSIQALMKILPDYANREGANGTIEKILPEKVEVGDILVIKPGEKVPVDGTVISGNGTINTAAITGESVPRAVSNGDAVVSGCINGDNLIKISADKLYTDSTVSLILKMVEDAAERKSKSEKFITRFARYYTPAVVAGAVVLWLIPSLITGNWAEWMMRACTFLVISCPCALVISIPLAFFGGIGAASRKGILVKGSNFLEMMAEVGVIATDKTGTLTTGRFNVSAIKPSEGVDKKYLLKLAAALERSSTHPIAISICEEAYSVISGSDQSPDIEATGIENISGKGLRGIADGKELLVGNSALMESEGIEYEYAGDSAATVSYVAFDGKFMGAILVSDTLKPETKEAISEMRSNSGAKIVMLTGDRKAVSDAMISDLDIDEAYSELLPQDKVFRVERMLKTLENSYYGGGIGADKKKDNKRKKLVCVGDGINDAPILSRADVGIAMGSLGSDAAIEAADVVIMDDDLRKIPLLMRIARRTIAIAKQNIFLTLSIKAIFLVLGAIGVANMWGAVFADVGVAIICTVNAMRMLGRQS